VDVASCLNENQKKELTHTLSNYQNYFISDQENLLFGIQFYIHTLYSGCEKFQTHSILLTVCYLKPNPTKFRWRNYFKIRLTLPESSHCWR